jgi:catechol 2,3-dioxygenase-like lactoylglutathione lyase family enzyme
VSITGLTAYAHVADVQRSVDFYTRLGLELVNRYEAESDGTLVWAFVASTEDVPHRAAARLMLALADEPIDPSAQAVLFYCWTPDVATLQSELRDAGIETSEIHHPHYMSAGELRIVDPDGYVLLVGQLGDRE